MLLVLSIEKKTLHRPKHVLAHRAGLEMSRRESHQLPALRHARVRIHLPECRIHAIESGWRRQAVEQTSQAEVCARADQAIDLRGREVFQQARNVVVEIVAVQGFGSR